MFKLGSRYEVKGKSKEQPQIIDGCNCEMHVSMKPNSSACVMHQCYGLRWTVRCIKRSALVTYVAYLLALALLVGHNRLQLAIAIDPISATWRLLATLVTNQVTLSVHACSPCCEAVTIASPSQLESRTHH